jgi:pimeloyl-ACP methyl ester carboxylesterase
VQHAGAARTTSCRLLNLPRNVAGRIENPLSVERIIKHWMDRGEPIRVPDANTRLWRDGEGEPVVCLHGVPASGFLYRKVLPALGAKGLQGITFDLPGLGFADRPVAFDYSWSGLARWMVHALDAARIDDFHMVVHDIGGPIGFEVIRRIPQRIRSLTVLNTLIHVESFRRPLVMEPYAHRGIGWFWLQGMRTPMIIPLLRAVGMHDAPTSDELRAYGALLLRGDGGRAFLKIMRGFERTQAFESNIMATLRRRRFPAQVIWGAQDPALRMDRYAPGICRALGLEDWHRVRGKHFLQEDSPLEIADRVATLVAGAVRKDQ